MLETLSGNCYLEISINNGNILIRGSTKFAGIVVYMPVKQIKFESYYFSLLN